MYPPVRDPRESSSLERAACEPFGDRESTLRLTSSPPSELRLERQRRRRCHRRMAADMCPPAGVTPTIATPSMARAG